MKVIQQSKNGIPYLIATLKEKAQTLTRAILWKIHHSSGNEDIALKIGRYKKDSCDLETLECETPKSELTLDDSEFHNLLNFIEQNYEPFKQGVHRYIPLDENFDQTKVEHLKALFENPNKQEVLNFVINNDIVPTDILNALQNQERIKSLQNFEEMLSKDLTEHEWQKWLKYNYWIFGSDFVKIIDEREIDSSNITDYLMQAYDGFLDIIEIKRPNGSLDFWDKNLDHNNYVPSMNLTQAITQATKYIYEIEREAKDMKTWERMGKIKTIKPRCVLIFGRSHDWNEEKRESYRILNSNYHNLTILTYDHVLARAKHILGLIQKDEAGVNCKNEMDNCPF